MIDNTSERMEFLAHDAGGRPLVFEVTVDYGREEGAWVGVCTALGVSTTADSPEAAREEMADMLLVYLDVLAEAGDLLACLSEQGVEVRAPAGPSAQRRVDALTPVAIAAA
ncbi:MAG: hypothetical protein OXI91_06230 [Chloroflexota bacterium]|nr:hypothetical protein [Chloroflexota bacterium]